MKNINIFALNINEISADSLNLLHEKQKERIEKIKNERAKKQAAAAELLVLYVVKKFKPVNVPVPPNRTAGEFGKPYFAENPDFKFNISHSGDWAVIAVSDCEIGIDIEKTGKLRTKVAERILHEKEKQYFFSLPESEQQAKFYDYWVIKESIVKAGGRGMNDSFRNIYVNLSENTEASMDKKGIQLLLLPFNDEYKIGVCIFSEEKYKNFINILSYLDIMV